MCVAMVDLNLSSIDVFYWNTIFKDGGKLSTDSPVSLYNPSCAPSKSRGWQIIHGQGRDDIVYFYLVKYIRTVNTLQLSSSPPGLQLPALTSYDLWLLA